MDDGGHGFGCSINQPQLRVDSEFVCTSALEHRQERERIPQQIFSLYLITNSDHHLLAHKRARSWAAH